MSRRWIVTVVGKDRPGIVAGVAKVLYGLGCNLEDSAMTRLEGEFAIMLIFSSPAKVTDAALRKAFQPSARRLHLVVHLKPLSKLEATAPRKQGRSYLISVYGADRPGIVFRISEALARAGINITDVHTHRSAAGGPSLYLMLLEVEAPARLSAEALEQRLKKLGKTLGVEVSLRSTEADVL
jgi:glycine cleavage system transcriptional repressor